MTDSHTTSPTTQVSSDDIQRVNEILNKTLRSFVTLSETEQLLVELKQAGFIHEHEGNCFAPPF